jgi:hypothetical protein
MALTTPVIKHSYSKAKLNNGMMSKREGYRKISALVFMLVFSTETFVPGISYALTSGPAQPEMQQFEAAGVSDMVDLFSGDLKQNIPLMDVGGYPVNLSYQSGTGIEDEASWVGAGWSLNPGAVNRTMRGLPDDFDGDKIQRHYETKKFVKVGGSFNVKTSLFGWEVGSPSVNLNIYKDNYWGIGASVGASLGATVGKNTATTLTAGMDITSDVRQGVTLEPSLSLSEQLNNTKENLANGSLSAGLSYNSRAGLKKMSLGVSFGSPKTGIPAELQATSLTYFGTSFQPSLSVDMKHSETKLSFDVGVSFGIYAGLGGKGFYETKEVKNKDVTVDGYGYLNYLNGRSNIDALLDFNREKDGVFVQGAPSIGVPVATPDFFTATGQTGSQQFRPWFSGNYVVFDKAHYDDGVEIGAGVTVGATGKVGGRIAFEKQSAYGKKWRAESGNNYLTKAEAMGKAEANNTDKEPVYFKQAGEHTATDNQFFGTFYSGTTQNIDLNSVSSAQPQYRSASGPLPAFPIQKERREIRNFGFSYLTAAQATHYGLEKTINTLPRVDEIRGRRAHHMSEVTVTANDGKRMVYGIPVYNHTQKEVSFSIQNPPQSSIASSRKTGLVGYGSQEVIKDEDTSYVPGHLFGREQLWSEEKTPSYATSFLLTGVLSTDYVDVTDDGITDDDLGTAVKFKYKKITTPTNPFRWRAPFQNNQVNFNEGLQSDKRDDKGSYVYGTKELWYVDAIENKTMIAIFFTSNREDALGVPDERGGKSIAIRQQKLDSIRLFSKSEWKAKGAAAEPLKTVHFEYDYSLFPFVPNNSGAITALNSKQGKLTLKKVYFTFGNNQRGKSNPYEFTYDETNASALGLSAGLENTDPLEANEYYATQQQDRWGTYKPSFYNKAFNSTASFPNSEFPYTLQTTGTAGDVKKINDHFASKWQLIKIITPTGSIIDITYESDDYAYVQNRRAMQMCPVSNVVSAKGFAEATALIVDLPAGVNTDEELRRKYLEGADNIFYKVMLDLDNAQHKEYVYGYAAIDIAASTRYNNQPTKARIVLKPVDGYNPIAKSAWQKLRTELPQYAYDSYDNYEVGDFGAAIRSIVSAIGNLRELVQSFDKRAINRHFASVVDYGHSMVRLNNPDGHKMGGGARVAKIMISDDWEHMASGNSSKFGQRYDYTTRNNDGSVVSSGVASYEPQVGNEENPFHEPVAFSEKIHWGIDNYHFIEKPYCESYFPSAQVGYSKVTVVPLGSTDDANPTGYTENEFYTAKDFPTIVENTSLQQIHTGNIPVLSLFASISRENMMNSQGFKVELNDMHGKPKSVKTYSKGGDLLSSQEFFYSVDRQNDMVKHLKNTVQIMKKDGSVESAEVGTNVDIVTDAREQRNENLGTSVGTYAGVLPIFFPIFYGALISNVSIFSQTYKSNSFVKVIHKSGILTKVRTMENGSTNEAENLVWDGTTGEVLLSRTQNVFNDYIYSFNYPAYMVNDYEGMGAAYQNLGAVFNLSFNGSTINSTGSAALFPGDELISLDLSLPVRTWVISSVNNGSPVLKLVDATGELFTIPGNFQVVRSGRRNLLNASVGTVVCAKDPRVEGKIKLTVDQKVIDAKSVQYNQDWAVPVANTSFPCGPGYSLSPNGYCFRTTVPVYTDSSSMICPGDRRPEYSACGTMIYDDFDPDNSMFVRTPIPLDKTFWIGSSGHHAANCPVAPDQTRNTGGGGPNADGDDFTKRTAARKNVPRKITGTTSLTTVGPLNRCGIWLCNVTGSSNWFGLSKTIYFPESKYYYFGMGSSNVFQLKIDGQAKLDAPPGDAENYKIWHIYPIFIPSGNHVVEIRAKDQGEMTALGLEIYNNTKTQIQEAESEFDLNMLFTTRGFTLGQYSCPPGSNLFTGTLPFSCREIVPPAAGAQCLDPVGLRINPYVKGAKGNWRTQTNWLYTVTREQVPGNPVQKGGTDIRHSGTYSTFTPFWLFSNGSLADNRTADVSHRWVWNNSSVYFDQHGSQIENVDALGRYGSALFGYQSTLATAVAANARHNEIMFDGFEDYVFQTSAIPACALPKHFDWKISKNLTTGIYQDDQGNKLDAFGHSGQFSLKLSHPVTIVKSAGSSQPSGNPVLTYDLDGRYKLNTNELAKGFAPVANKKQVLSMWVYEGPVSTTSTNTIQKLAITVNGTPLPVSTTTVAVVEGWKRLEISFTPTGNNFTIVLQPTGTVNIDDIRITPFDASMKSFVYDPYTLRLTGQLDDNNFATFYEYDDEGTLIRVKKETDRGIMTIKETRKAYRQRN